MHQMQSPVRGGATAFVLAPATIALLLTNAAAQDKAPLPPAEPATLATRLRLVDRDLRRFDAYCSFEELLDGMAVPLAVPTTPTPRPFDVTMGSRLRVRAALSEDALKNLRAANLTSACMRIQAQDATNGRVLARQDLSLPADAPPPPPSVVLAAQTEPFRMTVTAAPTPCDDRAYDWAGAAERTFLFAPRDPTDVLKAKRALEGRSLVRIAECRSDPCPGQPPDSWQLATGSSRPLWIEKGNALQVAADIGADDLSLLRQANIDELCISSKWEGKEKGDSHLQVSSLGATSSSSPPFESTAPIRVPAQTEAYTLTITATEGSCSGEMGRSLSQHAFRIDVDRFGVHLAPPVIADAVVFGHTQLPDTVQPTSVERTWQSFKVGFNWFPWDHVRATEGRFTRLLKRAFGLNLTTKVTVAGPGIPLHGDQYAISVGVVLAEPRSRICFIGVGRLVGSEDIKNHIFVFCGFSGTAIVSAFKSAP
jgi:hypothetical protein